MKKAQHPAGFKPMTSTHELYRCAITAAKLNDTSQKPQLINYQLKLDRHEVFAALLKSVTN